MLKYISVPSTPARTAHCCCRGVVPRARQTHSQKFHLKFHSLQINTCVTMIYMGYFNALHGGNAALVSIYSNDAVQG